MSNKNRLEANEKHSNCFFSPHSIYEDEKLKSLSHAERDFFFRLCSLSNRYADKDGWFWHLDKTFTDENGKKLGFVEKGFSSSTCVRTRIKLVKFGLIETKPHIAKDSENRHWPATMYRVNPKLLYGTRSHSEFRPETMVNLDPRPP